MAVLNSGLAVLVTSEHLTTNSPEDDSYKHQTHASRAV